MSEPTIGLPLDKIIALSDKARALYNTMYDYCTYAADPQYQRLHKFRLNISRLHEPDRSILIEYFNHDPAVRWQGMPCDPWQYYAKPY